MPVVVITPERLGVTGYESCAELEANAALRDTLEAIRIKAGELMGLGDVMAAAVPKMCLISKPTGDALICTRTFIPHHCHRAIGVLGAVSAATSVLTKGTVGYGLSTKKYDPGVHSLSLEHPSGSLTLNLNLDENHSITEAAVVRTARKLAEGVAFT